MMVSLQDFLRYHHNGPFHVISEEKILPYYSIWPEQKFPAELEHQPGVI